MEKRPILKRAGPPGESSQTEPASHLACSVCERGIPLSTALWRESSDYVAHFCGLECYDRWRSQPGSHGTRE